VAESKIETPDREKEKAREQEREEQKEQARQQKLKQERELARQEQMRQEQEKAEQRAIEKERAREQQQAFEEQKRQEADQARERELAEQRQAEAEAEAAAEAQQVAAASAQGGQKDGVSGGQAGGVAQGQPSGGGGMGDASPNYQAEVRAWLDRHKEYPVMARRRGQEGMAMVTFTFDRNGRILAYGLERETGHENLDQAVGDMIERADPLPAMPVDLAQNRMTWTMPVYFQLK
jgi:TonB family protein